jgi:hypothetical protein
MRARRVDVDASMPELSASSERAYRQQRGPKRAHAPRDVIDARRGKTVKTHRELIGAVLSQLIWQQRRRRRELHVESLAALAGGIAGALGHGSGLRLAVAALALVATWLACRDLLRLRTMRHQIDALARSLESAR